MAKSLRVGFWQDWNASDSTNADERETWEMFLGDLLERPITTVIIEREQDIRHADVDLLIVDYGGIRGGYGPNSIVPVVVNGLAAWCRKNADRIGLVSCTMQPDWYRVDWRKNQQALPNLYFYRTRDTDTVIDPILKARYSNA